VSETSGQHITRRDDGYQLPMRANTHPTVKPTELMRYLCRLVTPAGGVVLDPFMGSGSTGRGAVLEDLGFVGIEMDADYTAIAAARIAEAERMRSAEAADREAAESQMTLFAAEATA
jgi:site-specific DNA-methyltransferase (adenine-specific)